MARSFLMGTSPSPGSINNVTARKEKQRELAAPILCTHFTAYKRAPAPFFPGLGPLVAAWGRAMEILGADLVVKEGPGAGDVWRAVGRGGFLMAMLQEIFLSKNLPFSSLSSTTLSKRSLDFGTPKGMELLRISSSVCSKAL